MKFGGQAKWWTMATALCLGLATSSCAGSSVSTSAAAEPATASSASTPPTGMTSPSATSAATGQRTTAAKTRAGGTPSSTPASTGDLASRVFDRMSLQQRAGQLIMAGSQATGADDSTLSAISSSHVGNVILTGRSHREVTATAAVSARLREQTTDAATAKIDLFVATDQEGGQVQVLRGPGFSAIPDALTQGGWTASKLKASATTWGNELRSAGVNMNLAPVTDTVPQATAASNRPIGFFQREFGFSSAVVSQQAVAFVQGMRASGIEVTPKHFPGLGRVISNTDTTAGVTDSTTTRTDPYLEPFRQAIAAGAPFVMMSSAYYSKIDADNPACFSHTVITGLLRGDLGFRGVVISDDLGSARQVSRWSPGSRATQFIEAGGDVVLTVNPALAPSMASAIVVKANGSDSFRKLVDSAALRVLRAKAAAGLLPAA